VTLYDVVGLVGVTMILAAYAAAVLGALDPKGAAALTLNFIGPVLILVSLSQRFNLSAAIVEAAWALIALIGLIRVAAGRARSAAHEGDQQR
jgi:hypothetical protein